MICVDHTRGETQTTNEETLKLFSDIRDYKSSRSTVDVSPSQEGFLPLPEQQQQRTTPMASALALNTTILSTENTSTTTCQTVDQQSLLSSQLPSKNESNRTTDPELAPTQNHRSRRLLADQSSNADLATPIDASSAHIVGTDDTDMNSFLRVEDEELAMQLSNNAMAVEGSGTSMLSSPQPFSTDTHSLLQLKTLR